MPLSEHEQRLLEQMERALYAEDSKFVQTFRGSDSSKHRRRQFGLAVVGFVLGLGLLFVGVAVQGFYWVGAIGFLVMLGAVMYLLRSSRRDTTSLEVITGGAAAVAQPPRKVGKVRRGGRRTGFMTRVEERWRKRGEERGY